MEFQSGSACSRTDQLTGKSEALEEESACLTQPVGHHREKLPTPLHDIPLSKSTLTFPCTLSEKEKGPSLHRASASTATLGDRVQRRDPPLAFGGVKSRARSPWAGV